ncbi:unnamed protein product, partial [Phaeothamnion confervicola]
CDSPTAAIAGSHVAPAHGKFSGRECGDGGGSDRGGSNRGGSLVGSFGSRPASDIGSVFGGFNGGGGVRRCRMLVVDDTSANRRILAHQLELLGHHADMAGGGAEAVRMEAAAEPPYDCILLDLHMPGMDGVDVANEIVDRYKGAAAAIGVGGGGSIGATPQTRTTPWAATTAPGQGRRAGRLRPAIIVVTASALPSDRARCQAAGVDGFVTKPVNKRRLVECLDAALENRTRVIAT